MDEIISTPGLVILGFATLSFLLKWLFGRAEKALDTIVRQVTEVAQTVGLQATRIAVLEAKVAVLEQQLAHALDRRTTG